MGVTVIVGRLNVWLGSGVMEAVAVEVETGTVSDGITGVDDAEGKAEFGEQAVIPKMLITTIITNFDNFIIIS